MALIYLFSVMMIAPLLAFGWGGGHKTVGCAVASFLPEPWSSQLQGEALKQFCVDNGYPDACKKFTDDKRLTPAERAYLSDNKMPNSYHFHHDKGRGVAFCLLVRALRDNRPEGVSLWLGTLAHSTADMVACNHDPIAHAATYAWSDSNRDFRLPNGMSLAKMKPALDLGWVDSNMEAGAIWAKSVAEVKAVDSCKGAEDAVLDVLLAGPDGVGTCCSYGLPVVKAAMGWTVTKEPGYEKALGESFSVLGCWAVERVLRDFLVAQRLAESGIMPNVTDAVMKRYQEEFAKFVLSRDYEEDSFVEGLTRPLNQEKPFLGVVSEPTWRMDEGMFGFNDRVLAAQSVTALRKQGRNSSLVDVREFIAEGCEVEKAPVLLFLARKVSDYHTLKSQALKEQMTKYRQAGGKIIWIGGGLPDEAFHDFPSNVAQKADVGKGYVNYMTRLPVDTNAYATLTLKIGDHTARKLERSPNFMAGWHIPSNTTYFKPEATESIIPLAYLYDSAKPLLIGGAWPKDAPEFAYLPTYTLFPYLWTMEMPSLVPFEIGLDSQGLETLETALTALRAEHLF